MPSPNVVAVTGVWIPLARAALCLEEGCETIFELGSDACPRCARQTWVVLGRFLRERAA